MATLAELNIVIGAQIDGFEAAMDKVQQGIGRAGDAAKKAGETLSTFVSLPLGLLGIASLKAAGDIQALEKGFAATYKGSEDLSAALAKVKELAKLPGLGLKEALQGATNLQAAGFSADLATRALGAFGNALATVGKGKADLDGVGLALGQIASKGKISAEEINQLAERVPQIRQAMIAAFGSADTEVLQKAKISATTFVEGVTAELEKLPKVSGGLNNAFENLSDAATIALSKIGNSLNKTFDVEGLIGRVSDFLTGLAEKFEALDPAMQKTIFVVTGLVAAAGPLLVALGAVAAALPVLAGGFALLTGPVGLVALAIGAAAALIIDNWDAIVAYFAPTGEGGQAFSILAESVGNAVTQIRAAFAALNDGNSLDGLISASGIVKALFQSLAVGITAVVDIVGGAIGAIVKLFKGDFAGSLEQAKRALFGLIDPIANVLGFTKKAATELKGTFADAFTQPDYFADVPEQVAAASVKVVAALTPQQKALEKLEQNLRDNRNASRALGEEYDFIGGKAKVLEAGIKSLTDVGFAPGGAVVQRYLSQLRGVPEALDAINLKVQAGIENFGRADKTKLNVLEGFNELNNLDVAGGRSPYQLPVRLNILPVDDAAINAALDNMVLAQTGALGQISQAQRDAVQAQADFNTNTEALIEAFPVAGFMAIGEAIGGALASGGDVFEAAGKALLKVLADFGAKYGQQLILLGIADVATGIFVAKGVAEIAAGTALVAGSALLGGLASGSSSRGGGGGAGPSASIASTPRSSFTPTVAPGAAAQGPAAVTHYVNFQLQGNQLSAALQIETDRFGRVTGR